MIINCLNINSMGFVRWVRVWVELGAINIITEIRLLLLTFVKRDASKFP